MSQRAQCTPKYHKYCPAGFSTKVSLGRTKNFSHIGREHKLWHDLLSQSSERIKGDRFSIFPNKVFMLLKSHDGVCITFWVIHQTVFYSRGTSRLVGRIEPLKCINSKTILPPSLIRHKKYYSTLSNTSNEWYKHNDVQKVNQIKFVVDGISITAFCYQISIVMDV